MNTPTIVIAAYQRPKSLRALLASLDRADIASGTRLIISIDGGAPEQPTIRRIADDYDWAVGPKEVVEHDHLGLVGHFHRCGDLSAEQGDIVLLEDDLLVGPAFHRWATTALDHARDDERIAGVSLAAPWFDGYRQLPFEPIDDGSDGIYMQVPWYDGMAWTPDMWQRFRKWDADPTVPVHASLDTLDDDEWFPTAMRYLVASDSFYLLPRHAQVTNTGAAGAHFDERTDVFQARISLATPHVWRLRGLDDSLAVYDDHMELTETALRRIVGGLPDESITVDLLGVRDLQKSDGALVLTTRRTNSYVRSWGARMHPLVANLVFDVPGAEITLAAARDVESDPASDAAALATLRTHANRGRTTSLSGELKNVADKVVQKLRRG